MVLKAMFSRMPPIGMACCMAAIMGVMLIMMVTVTRIPAAAKEMYRV